MSGKTAMLKYKTVIDCLDFSTVPVIPLPDDATNVEVYWSRYWLAGKYYHYFGYTYNLED